MGEDADRPQRRPRHVRACRPGVPSVGGAPCWNKKAKRDKYDKSSAASVQASIDKCLADVTNMSKQNASTFADSWSSLMSKHDEKVALQKEKIKLENELLKVETEKAQAAVMQAETARMQAMSDASQSVTRKMKEDSRTLTADLSAYSPEVQAWFKISQQRILLRWGFFRRSRRR